MSMCNDVMDVPGHAGVVRALGHGAETGHEEGGATALYPAVEAACEQACSQIAPAWPLDRAIAVNPHWERIQQPVRRVAARMAVLGGIQVYPPRDQIRNAWEQGRIGEDDLRSALSGIEDARLTKLTPQACVAALHEPLNAPQLPLLIDLLDDDPLRAQRLSWRDAITHQVSQTCASFFDEHQADWQPAREQGLYAYWRETLTHDHGIGVLMGLPQLGRHLHALPATRQDAEVWAMRRLSLPGHAWADYLESVLLTVNGWASWCAYLRWQARLAGSDDAHLRDLLAIRLAWGAVLLQCKADGAGQSALTELQRQWARSQDAIDQAYDALWIDEVWQTALEQGYQRELAGKLLGARGPQATVAGREPVQVQAAFCIDVRSEPMRRALEAAWPAVQTIGFAGFFGLPSAYSPLGSSARWPQLPGLLAPSVTVEDRVLQPAPTGQSTDLTAAAVADRQRRWAWSAPWDAASRWPGASYSYVEAAGWGYVAKLAQWLRPSTDARARLETEGLPVRYRPLCRPTLSGLGTPDKVALAAKILHAMGIDRHIAPIVLLVGHGSQSANNAHAAALDCGACCGQSGEVNVRALAQMLNEPAVRAGLRSRGIDIPEHTAFIAALHNTTTDEIEGFDLDTLPAPALARWQQLVPVWARACDQVRRERAPSLQLDPTLSEPKLLLELRRRANDGAQTRPEWGLAGNASFVIAPRSRTVGVALQGRSFLHDYDSANDADGSVLELLMTAPMLVTHWINWQYHASTCDPQRLGSGNKVLHNVVGGRTGVFEGNGGDLRIGLSQQSVHDGQRFVHEPLRLTVVIDAPASRIEHILQRHAVVRHLVDNGWLYLWRFADDGMQRYQRGRWVPIPRTTPAP